MDSGCIHSTDRSFSTKIRLNLEVVKSEIPISKPGQIPGARACFPVLRSLWLRQGITCLMFLFPQQMSKPDHNRTAPPWRCWEQSERGHLLKPTEDYTEEGWSCWVRLSETQNPSLRRVSWERVGLAINQRAWSWQLKKTCPMKVLAHKWAALQSGSSMHLGIGLWFESCPPTLQLGDHAAATPSPWASVSPSVKWVGNLRHRG